MAAEAGSCHIFKLRHKAKKENWKQSEAIWPQSANPHTHTHNDESSLTRLQPHKTPQVASPTGKPVFRYQSLWRTFSFWSPKGTSRKRGWKDYKSQRKRNTFLCAYYGHCSPELSAAVIIHTKHEQDGAHLCREEFTRSLISRRICRQLRVSGRNIFFSGAISPRLLTLLLLISPVKLTGSPSKTWMELLILSVICNMSQGRDVWSSPLKNLTFTHFPLH